MNSFDQRKLICHLVKAMHKHGSWVGETHIQKCSMFLQKLLNVPIEHQFVLYKHGPYSFDLRGELAEMRVRYLLDVKPHPQYAPSYVLGYHGERFVGLPTDFAKEVEFVSSEVSRKTVVELERVSTVFFIKEANPGMEKTDVASLVCRLKPHINPSQALSAVDEVERIVNAAVEQGLIASQTGANPACQDPCVD